MPTPTSNHCGNDGKAGPQQLLLMRVSSVKSSSSKDQNSNNNIKKDNEQVANSNIRTNNEDSIHGVQGMFSNFQWLISIQAKQSRSPNCIYTVFHKLDF